MFCGEALCKAPIPAAPPASGPWPLRCPSCAAALYPADVLASLLPSQRAAKAAELMVERGAAREPITSDQLRAAPAPRAEASSGDDGGLDRLLAMVELDPAAARRARRRKTAVIAVVLVMAIATIAAALIGASRS